MTVTREAVTVEQWVDGELRSSRTEYRNVHRPANGEAYIRTQGGRKPLASDNPPTVVWSARTVQSVDIGAIIASIPADVPVRVIGLFG